jgi:hypothetical protein
MASRSRSGLSHLDEVTALRDGAYTAAMTLRTFETDLGAD